MGKSVGVTHSLHLIEPTTFARVVAELKPHPFTSVRNLEEYLDRYQVTDDAARQTLISKFSELFAAQDADWIKSAYSELLAKVVTETEWYLDKSLNYYGLDKPLRTFPALKPLRFLVSMTGWDTEPPEELFCESGLYGLWSATFLESACQTIDCFATRDDAQKYAQSVDWSLLDRIFRRPARADKAVAVWLDYLDHWEQIRTAIKETVRRGWSLGYAMCP